MEMGASRCVYKKGEIGNAMWNFLENADAQQAFRESCAPYRTETNATDQIVSNIQASRKIIYLLTNFSISTSALCTSFPSIL